MDKPVDNSNSGSSDAVSDQKPIVVDNRPSPVDNKPAPVDNKPAPVVDGAGQQQHTGGSTGSTGLTMTDNPTCTEDDGKAFMAEDGW